MIDPEKYLKSHRIVLTDHAIQRLKEVPCTIPESIKMLKESVKDCAKGLYKYKKRKYADCKDETFYRRYGSVLFTCVAVKDKFSKDDIVLVLTVTEQQATLKSWK